MVEFDKSFYNMIKVCKVNKTEIINKISELDKTNHYGGIINVGSMNTKYSHFVITAIVVYHSENDVMGGYSSFDNKYKVFVEQFVNGIQLTKIKQISNINRNGNSVSGKYWAIENSSTTSVYEVVNLY